MFTPKIWHLFIVVLAIITLVWGAWYFFPPQNSIAATAWTIREIYDVAPDADFDQEMVLGTDQLPQIVLYEESDDNLVYLRCTSSDCAQMTATFVDETGNVGLTPSIAVASDGFARIAYYDFSNSSLKFAQCTDEDCSTSEITTIDSTGDVGWYPSVRMGLDGFARISYYDMTNGNLKFVQCEDADCATNNITAVDTTGDVGMSGSMAIGSDGLARISYFDGTNSDLKFVQCLNADCSSSQISTVDSTGTVGQTTSMVLGDDGNARITYLDSASGGLKFASCANAACTSGTITEIADDGGIYSSVGMGSDDLPRIAYYDSTNQNLIFVQCTDSVCTTHETTIVESDGTVGRSPFLAINNAGMGRIAYLDTSTTSISIAYEEEVASADTTSTNSETTSSTDPGRCTDETPVGIPTLFRIDTASSYVNIYFTRAEKHVSGYTVNYGLSPEANQYSDSFDFNGGHWIIGRTISGLSANKTYYFRVQTRNGCNASEWSNIMKAKTKSKLGNINAWFSNLIGSGKPKLEGSESSSSVTIKTPSSCDYTVKSGDTLWKIAEAELGDGFSYTEIRDLNPGIKNLKVGQKIKICN